MALSPRNQTLADKIRLGAPIPRPLAALLVACTPVVRVGMWMRLRGPRERVPAKVISFGNITAGGAGKTPAVIERARAELASGKKVAVLTRGYSAAKGEKLRAVEGGSKANPVELSATLGDEGALLVMKLPGAVIVRCADRVAGARHAMDRYGCDTLILDDGYQYVRLERDENILLIDATNPFGNSSLIPRGILREPLDALARATHFILTRCDQARGTASLSTMLAERCPGVPQRMTRHAPVGFWRVADREPLPLDWLSGRRVVAACAIGNPDAFFRTLEGLPGATLTARHAYPDHAVIPPALLDSDDTIVVTEKDALKIKDARPNVVALEIELRTQQERERVMV